MNTFLYLLLVYLTYTYGSLENQGYVPLLDEDEDEKEIGYDKRTDSQEEKINSIWSSAVILSNLKPYFHDPSKYRQPLYLCPGENYQNDGCLYIQEQFLRKKVRKFIDCNAGEFYPTLINTKKRCGDGTWYVASYKVCKKIQLEEESEQTAEEIEEKQKREVIEERKKLHDSNIRKKTKDAAPQENKNVQQPAKQNSSQHHKKDEGSHRSTSESVKNNEPVNEENQDLISLLDSELSHNVEIFSYCFDKISRQTLYVKYKITILGTTPIMDYHTPKIKTFPSTRFGDLDEDMSFLVDVYKKDNQKVFLDKLYKDEGEEDRDFLIPNELIPPPQVAKNLSRGLLQNLYNIRPIWNSQRENWTKIWSKLAQVQCLDGHGMQLTVYSGTYGQLRLEHEDLYLKYKDNEISIPIIWWILLIDEAYHKGIILALDNVPSGYELKEEHQLCEKMPCPFNWEIIQEWAGGYCCEITEERLLRFNMPLVQVKGIIDFNYRVAKREEED